MLSLEAFNSVFPENEISSSDIELILSWMGPNQLLQAPEPEVIAAIQRTPNKYVILERYKDAVRLHFMKYALPLVKESNILAAAKTLQEAQAHYEYPVKFLNPSAEVLQSFSRSFKALVHVALPYKSLKHRLSTDIFQEHKIYQLDNTLKEVYFALRNLGLQDEVDKIVAIELQQEVKEYVKERFTRNWETSSLVEYQNWAGKCLFPALQVLVDHGHQNDDTTSSGYWEQLYEIGQDAIADLRIEELFDIVINMPHSLVALSDLKECMKKSSQRAAAVSAFQQSCAKRLLQGGATTVDIIRAYMLTIDVFSTLEPRGVLLDKVSRPIRRYLRERDDTIKIIVSSLMLEGGDECIDELSEMLSDSKKKDLWELEDLLDIEWSPDPLDAPPDFKKDRYDDALGSLISLYDNKDVFVREFIDLFADRMLKGESMLKIMEILELLKLRFGERELQNLDVMVRDINDSKRLDKQIHGDGVRGRPIFKKFHASILSRLFWPKFRSSELELPPVIAHQMEMYGTRFSTVKPNRKLKWMPNLGTVKLEIQLQDRNVEMDVTPEQAAIIAAFQTGAKSIQDIEQQFNMSTTHARQLVTFWVHKGVLKHDGEVYRVVETKEESAVDDLQTAGEDAEEDMQGSSSLQSAEERAKEEMAFYWSYINGMLTNLGATPLDRIHSFLKMVVPKETPYTKTVEELEQFLNAMVSDGNLVMSGTNYQLPK